MSSLLQRYTVQVRRESVDEVFWFLSNSTEIIPGIIIIILYYAKWQQHIRITRSNV